MTGCSFPDITVRGRTLSTNEHRHLIIIFVFFCLFIYCLHERVRGSWLRGRVYVRISCVCWNRLPCVRVTFMSTIRKYPEAVCVMCWS